jgi:N-acetylneuraminic acid mutarotase
VWTGEKMIVFGGVLANGTITNSGAVFDPVTNTWQAISTIGAPARAYHRSLWTGAKMIVWGGLDPSASQFGAWQSSGAMYDPETDQWEAISSPRAEGLRIGARTSQTIVLAEDKLIIWGSASGNQNRFSPEAGAVFDLTTKQWSLIPHHAQAPYRWSGHSAIYHQGKMIVWGGKPLPGLGGAETNQGAVLDVASMTWSAMSPSAQTPSARIDHQAVLTGDKMLVFGGQELQRNVRGSGGVYDIASGQWTNIQSEIAPQRYDHTLVWTGAEALIWGGKAGVSSNALNGVSALDPLSTHMRAVSVNSAPAGRSGHSAVWTGISMIVWGGVSEAGQKLGDGGLFYP